MGRQPSRPAPRISFLKEQQENEKVRIDRQENRLSGHAPASFETVCRGPFRFGPTPFDSDDLELLSPLPPAREGVVAHDPSTTASTSRPLTVLPSEAET
jgi:hypothetical protein